MNYCDAHGKRVTPRAWLRIWAAQYPGQKYDREHDRLVALTQKKSADFERIGRWKDAASSGAKWKANVASVAYVVWMQAASERPACPTDDTIADFLLDWSSRTDEDRFGTRTVKKRFGLSRATTLLYFLTNGRFPIFDSRVRRAIARLTDRPVSNTVQAYVDSYLPLFAQIATRCGAKDLRTVDQALFSYGGKDTAHLSNPPSPVAERARSRTVLAYGDRGVPGSIPPGAVLTAEITMLGTPARS